MAEKSWINSYSAILIGISFLLLASIEILIYYYSNTIHPINITIKIAFSAGILILLGVVLNSLIRPLFKNARQNLPLKNPDWLTKKIYDNLENMFSFVILLFAVSMMLIVIFGAPYAVLTYGFTCSKEYPTYSDLKLDVRNDGQIYGNYKFLVTSNESNVMSYKKIGEDMTDWISFTISPNQESLNRIGLDLSDFDGAEFEIYNNFTCTTDCSIITLTTNQEICKYRRNPNMRVYELVE